MATIESGNSAQLTVTFYDFSGSKVDPQLVKFKVYRRDYSLVEEFTLNATHKVSTGTYVFYYTSKIADTDKVMYYEFYGEIEGTPTLKRGCFSVKFLEGNS